MELDCRGQLCPMPVLALARAIGEVAVGDVITVLATDPAAAVDIAAWCRMKGQEYLGVHTEEDGTPAYGVRRTS
jgi:tRNA 2-thiouridine synthesizing protein A